MSNRRPPPPKPIPRPKPGEYLTVDYKISHLGNSYVDEILVI